MTLRATNYFNTSELNGTDRGRKQIEYLTCTIRYTDETRIGEHGTAEFWFKYFDLFHLYHAFNRRVGDFKLLLHAFLIWLTTFLQRTITTTLVGWYAFFITCYSAWQSSEIVQRYFFEPIKTSSGFTFKMRLFAFCRTNKPFLLLAWC